MALQLAIMIEGQEGLTWERWRRLAQAVEEAGFAGLFRSDHLTGLFGEPTRPSLDTWASLTWLASHTRGLRFGNFVQIRDIINQQMEELWAGKKTAKEALHDAAEQGNALLREFEQQNS